MKSDLDCARIRAGLSARLDREVDATTAALLDDHLSTCAACREHEEAMRRVKRAVALQPAPQVRDLTPAVMARIVDDRRARRSERRALLRTALAAAVITALVMSGGVLPLRRGSDIVLASEITRAVQSAATDIDSYHAAFDVVERGWHRRVPERRFTAEIWFEAPERLRMEITDRTAYPGAGWPTNDATLIAQPHRWWLKETASCPAPALPGCEVAPEPEVRALDRRQPFDGATSLPTDLILPLETLSDGAGLTVVGRDEVGGRDAHHVVLEYWQATPLIESLQVAGTWRRFPATARVDLWVDAETWFPLRFTVRSGGGSLSAHTTFLDHSAELAPSIFDTPSWPQAADGGFRGAEVDALVPRYRAGLRPYRTGLTREGQQLTTFVDGMTWLKVLVDGDTTPTIDTFASEIVGLDGGRYVYLEPSRDPLRRTAEIIGSQRRVRLESNLPRAELLEVAASVPLSGRAIDRIETATGSTIERVIEANLAAIPHAAEPSYLPDGFRFSSAFVSTSSQGTQQLTIYYRRPQSNAVMNDIRIVHAPDMEILPPSSENLVSIRAGDLNARWSPLRSELEWLDRTTYRAVAVPAFDLDTAIRVARSIDR